MKNSLVEERALCRRSCVLVVTDPCRTRTRGMPARIRLTMDFSLCIQHLNRRREGYQDFESSHSLQIIRTMSRFLFPALIMNVRADIAGHYLYLVVAAAMLVFEP